MSFKVLRLFLEIIISIFIVYLHFGLKKWFYLFLLLFFLIMTIQLKILLVLSILWH